MVARQNGNKFCFRNPCQEYSCFLTVLLFNTAVWFNTAVRLNIAVWFDRFRAIYLLIKITYIIK